MSLSSEQQRLTIIDAFRGVAVLFVVFYHYNKVGIFEYGLYGVLLFFVVSGFCILRSAESSVSAWHFYAKRLARLLPALIICGFITTAVKYQVELNADRVSTWGDYLYTVFSLPILNIFKFEYKYPDGAYWSLYIEFAFYWVVALAVFLSKRYIPLVVVLTSCVMSVLVLRYGWHFTLLSYLPFFIAGMGLAKLKSSNVILGVLLLAFAYLFYGLLFYYGVSDPSMPTTTTAFGFFVGLGAVFYVFAVLDRKGKLFEFYPLGVVVRVFAWVGLISYPLYLIHQDVGYVLFALLDDYGLPGKTSVVGNVVVAAAMVLLAALIYYGLERQAIKKVTGVLLIVGAYFNKLIFLFQKPGLNFYRTQLVVRCSILLLLLFFSFRAYDTIKVNHTIVFLNEYLRGETPSLKSAWSVVDVNLHANFFVVDYHGVSPWGCAPLMRQLQKIPGAKRIASSTHAKDEVSTPIDWLATEISCLKLGLGPKYIRVFVEKPNPEGNA